MTRSVTDVGRSDPHGQESWAALGGVLGPAAFAGAWIAGGLLVDAAYSPVDDAISRLAAVGANTRGLMSAGFVVFGVGVPVFALALRRHVVGGAWITAVVTGLATLAVAATPLDRSGAVDTWHGAFATIGYVTLAATPLLAARPLRRTGHERLAGFGVAMGVVSGVALVLTATSLPNGLFQRLGLTATDAWIVVMGCAIVRRRLQPTPRPDGA